MPRKPGPRRKFMDCPALHCPETVRKFLAVGQPKVDPKTGAMTREAERLLFLRYNFCKMVDDHDDRLRVRNWIATVNYPMMIHYVTTKTRLQGTDREDRIAEMAIPLLRCIDQFDVSRGFKFSTYLMTSMRRYDNRLYKMGRAQCRGGGRAHPTAFSQLGDDTLGRKFDPEHDHQSPTDFERPTWDRIDAALQRMEPEHAEVLRHRLGLHVGATMTFAQLGAKLGLCRERIRQIQTESLCHVSWGHEHKTSRPAPHRIAKSGF